MRSFRERVSALLALLLLAAGLLPVFQLNVLAPGDAYFFSNWDRESQALVLGEIERDERNAAPSRFGLQNARPDVLSPYATFDGLETGARPTASDYVAYPSSLGLQGRFFAAVHGLGCSTLGCLTTVESGLFSLVLVAFTAVLWRTVRRSLAVAVLVSSVLSPWVVSAAHNLYWVPWTWLLPAVAASGLAVARSRRQRTAVLLAVAAATALKSSTGYEFLTTTTLLAASMPVMAHLLGRHRTWRAVLMDAASVVAVCIAAFLVVLLVHAAVSGEGSVATGLQTIAHDALKRTYGSPSLGADGITARSLEVSPLQVLGVYLFDWRSSLFSIGIGTGFTPFAAGPGAFWVLVVAAVSLVVVDAVRQRPRWRRNAVLIATAAAPAVSWFVIGKSHSFTATTVNFVLWYLVLVPVLVWVLAEALGALPWVRGGRRLLAGDPRPAITPQG